MIKNYSKINKNNTKLHRKIFTISLHYVILYNTEDNSKKRIMKLINSVTRCNSGEF